MRGCTCTQFSPNLGSGSREKLKFLTETKLHGQIMSQFTKELQGTAPLSGEADVNDLVLLFIKGLVQVAVAFMLSGTKTLRFIKR